MSLANKVAVITGGSRGIGKAVAVALAERGASIVIGDLLDKEGHATVAEFNKSGKKVAVYQHTDVTKYKDLLALFALAEKEFGGVDIAILNAGIGHEANIIFEPLDDREDMRMQEINLGGVIKGSKVAVLHLAKRGGGVIVNTASVAGLVGFGALNAYIASKHGVVGWTRSLESLERICNVRVNAVCPYWVATEMINLDPTHPGHDFLKASPKCSMQDVVKAFVQCIEDSNLNGSTMLVMPDGIHEVTQPELPESGVSEELLLKIPEFEELATERAKAKLAEALARAKL